MAVAATGVQARDAGLGVVADGGTAVDAAIAAALVAASTEPGIVSLAGGAYVALWPAPGSTGGGVDPGPVVVDGTVAMPGRSADPALLGRGVREVVTEYGGGVTLHAGIGSVATPGAVAALALAAERYGTLSWARLVAPAEDAVRHGYPTSHAAARYLGFVAASLFGDDPEARALVAHPDGTPLRGGEPAQNLALADTLAALAEQGPSLFTTGEVGQRLVRQMAELGGLVGADDLVGHEALVRPAVVRDVGPWQVATNPPPSVGGPVLAVLLEALARRRHAGEDWGWAEVVEAQRVVLGHRLDVLDVADDLDAAGRAMLDAVERHGLGGLPRSGSTAHVSAVDADGGACAITMSSGYGAGLVVPGTGVLLNNGLGELELNRHGLHALAPGTRLASNMAPTTARASGGRTLAAGSPGADRITTALQQVLAHVCLRGADLAAAIDRPRLHVRRPDPGRREVVVEHEPDPELAAAVAASGLRAHAYPGPHMYFGGVGAAMRREDGSLQAAGDGRREAAVGVRTPEPGA